MQEIRCGQCQRKLAMAEFVRLQIKCSRCGVLNDLRAVPMDKSPPLARRRAPSTLGLMDDDNATQEPARLVGRQKPPG
nr:Com family DNA-binding transcriptional regulator [Rhodoferax sp.]